MTVSRPKSGDLKKGKGTPFRECSPSVPKPSPETPEFPATPQGEIEFQFDRLRASMGIILDAINGQYSPYDRLRWFTTFSDELHHEFHPELLKAIEVIAGYVDTVVAPEGSVKSLIWAIQQGQINGKLVMVPKNYDFEDDLEESIMLGMGLDIGRYTVYWRHPWDKDFEGPVVVSTSPGSQNLYPISKDDYLDIKTAVLEYNQEIEDWREAIKASKNSPEMRALLDIERLQADEVIPLPEWKQRGV